MPTVTALVTKTLQSTEDMALRRAAVQVAAQLPADLEDALAVLTYARQIVTEFLAPQP